MFARNFLLTHFFATIQKASFKNMHGYIIYGRREKLVWLNHVNYVVVHGPGGVTMHPPRILNDWYHFCSGVTADE